MEGWKGIGKGEGCGGGGLYAKEDGAERKEAVAEAEEEEEEEEEVGCWWGVAGCVVASAAVWGWKRAKPHRRGVRGEWRRNSATPLGCCCGCLC